MVCTSLCTTKVRSWDSGYFELCGLCTITVSRLGLRCVSIGVVLVQMLGRFAFDDSSLSQHLLSLVLQVFG